MKQVTNKKRSKREFSRGYWIFLKLQPYRHCNVMFRKNFKLNPRYSGPYQVMEKIVALAYKIKLPRGSLIHPIFHVLLLKKKVGDTNIVSSTLSKRIKVCPVAILDRKLIKKDNKAVMVGLI
jgi:hypothetical protein